MSPKSDPDSRFNDQFIRNRIKKHVKWHHRMQLATFWMWEIPLDKWPDFKKKMNWKKFFKLKR